MRNVLKFITTEADHRVSVAKYGTHAMRRLRWHLAGADPEWLQEWIRLHGPYFFHRTGVNAYDSIMKQGLLPHDTEGIGSKYEKELVPRANHSYIQTMKGYALHHDDPHDAGYVPIGVDLRKLDPAMIHADEDAFATTHAQSNWGLPTTTTAYYDALRMPDGTAYHVKDQNGHWFKHWGDFADQHELNHPAHVAHSINDAGTASVEGGIPPEALVPMHKVREDLEANYPHTLQHYVPGRGSNVQLPYTGERPEPKPLDPAKSPQPPVNNPSVPGQEYDYEVGDVVSDPLNEEGHGVVEQVKPGDILVVKHEDGSITEGHASQFEPLGGTTPQWYKPEDKQKAMQQAEQDFGSHPDNAPSAGGFDFEHGGFQFPKSPGFKPVAPEPPLWHEGDPVVVTGRPGTVERVVTEDGEHLYGVRFQDGYGTFPEHVVDAPPHDPNHGFKPGDRVLIRDEGQERPGTVESVGDPEGTIYAVVDGSNGKAWGYGSHQIKPLPHQPSTKTDQMPLFAKRGGPISINRPVEAALPPHPQRSPSGAYV
jgi:hypothetical protein